MDPLTIHRNRIVCVIYRLIEFNPRLEKLTSRSKHHEPGAHKHEEVPGVEALMMWQATVRCQKRHIPSL